MGGNIKVATTQKDWDNFFAEWDNPQDAIDSMDSYGERVRVACELSGREIKKTTQRLAKQTQEKIRVSIEFEFDR